MIGQPVEWVLVVYYGPEAHRATYGRQVRSNRYTKDYIQLSRKKEFLDAVANLFSVTTGAAGPVPLTYRWPPTGVASGEFVFRSSDRPHLKWETSEGAPQVWKMTLAPSDVTSETIPGDPSRLEFADAEEEFELLSSRGAGQPYLMAIKLLDEPRTLHLRVYLKDPSESYAWADLGLVPTEIQTLAATTRQTSALAWSLFQSSGIVPSVKVEEAVSTLAASGDRTSVIDALDVETGRALTSYLRRPGHGLFFDPTRNHDAWLQPAPLPTQIAQSVDDILQALEARFPPILQGDAAAEALEADPDETEAFCGQIENGDYAVADSVVTVKSRGSAQKAFADAVKANYGYRCAVTGVVNKDFLVASHIVPWSKDQTIRLDPSNGICLSLIVDRAFEKGYLQVEDDLTIRIDWSRVGDDSVLRGLLEPYEGQKVSAPSKEAPRPEYLQRRRVLIGSA